MPSALDETRFISAWRFIIAQQPKVFTFSAVNYTGFMSDINNTIDLGIGGFTQGNDTRLFCLRADFLSTVPTEGDIVTVAGIPYRISQVTVVKTFGLVFTLEGPSKP